MKNILVCGLLVLSTMTLAKSEFDIRGNYKCVDIVMKANEIDKEHENSKIELTYETSIKTVSVTQLDSGDLNFKMNDQEVKQVQLNFSQDVVALKGISVSKNALDKYEMTFYKDANSKTKVYLEGVTIATPSTESNPRAFNFSVECK